VNHRPASYLSARRSKGLAALVLALVLALSGSVFAEQKIDGYKAKKHVVELCKDEYEGRLFGMPGALKAADYIAGQFKEFGLEPAGTDGTYFQEFTTRVVQAVAPTSLRIEGEVNARKIGPDFALLQYSGAGKATADVVFVGYGISSPEKGLDEYEGIDVKGKIVMCIRRAPGDDQGKWEPEVYIGYKSKTAAEHGAVGFLMVERQGPDGKPTQPISGTIQDDNYVPDLPAVSISSDVAAKILEKSGKPLLQLQSEIDKDTKPVSFDTGRRVSLQVTTFHNDNAPAKNVLGMLRGSDPELKDQYVIVSGHLDHLGKDPSGAIYRGADDDASGIGCMLEIARTMKENGYSPERSIIFAGWTGEEAGLVGSRYFVDHPTVPLEKTVCIFQMDMVGRGEAAARLGGLASYPEIQEVVKADPDITPAALSHVQMGRGGGGSDHAAFTSRGVPGTMVISSGDHSGYHTPQDTPDRIKPAVLAFCAQLVYDAASAVADSEKVPLPTLHESGGRGR
jgi:hypothetical protein